MRVDQFLKASRLILRRAVAQELCAAGAVTINGAVARPGRTVRVGDRITLHRGERSLSVRVISLPITRQSSRHEATGFYEILGEADVLASP